MSILILQQKHTQKPDISLAFATKRQQGLGKSYNKRSRQAKRKYDFCCLLTKITKILKLSRDFIYFSQKLLPFLAKCGIILIE